MKLSSVLTLVFLASGVALQSCRQLDDKLQERASAPVVMICEHGSVKSVMAAQIFNRAAVDRRLPFRAVARGMSPDSFVPPAIAVALARDGFEVEKLVPTKISEAEVKNAPRVVLIGLESTVLGPAASEFIESWADVPAASTDYGAAKASLERHIASLLDDLEGSAE